MTYYKDVDNIYQHHFNNEHIEALGQIEQCLGMYINKKQELIFMKLCALSRLNKVCEAMTFVNDLIREKCWLNPNELCSDKDLDSIRNTDYFNKLYDFSLQSFKSYSAKQKYIENHRYTSFDVETKLVMYIHGRGSNISEANKECENIFESIINNINLIIPQSQEVYLLNQYCWDDELFAINKLGNRIEKLYCENFLLVGKSQGARIALELFCNNPKLTNLFLLIPALYSLNNIEELIHKLKANSKKRIYIITSENDFRKKTVEEFVKIIRENNITCDLDILENCGHYLPELSVENYRIALKYFD